MKPNNALTAIVAMALLWGVGAHSGSSPRTDPAPGPGGGRRAGDGQEQRHEGNNSTLDTELSNWGRWGKDDERGTINLITAEKRKQAAATVKTGTMVSLARNIARQKPADTTGPRPINRMGGLANLFLMESAPGRDGDYLFERQEIEYHGGELSHFDALCHVAYKGKNYNGFVFKEIVTKDGGCSKLAVTNIKDGIVTRGILLDLPDTQVRLEDIAAWEKKTGLRISSGDALLLRTKRPGGGAAGPGGFDPAIIPFLKERDVALLGADIAQEGGEIPGVTLPMH